MGEGSGVLLLGVDRKGFHLLNVFLSIILVERKGLLLGRAVDIGLILQELLHSEQNLLDCYVWLPVLLFIENREADCA
jgi:hypothetical protein